MFRKILTAALISTAASFGAIAATGPVVMDEAQSRSVTYDRPSANIVGSADVEVTGHMDSRTYETRRVISTQRPDGMYRFGVRQNWSLRVDSNS